MANDPDVFQQDTAKAVEAAGVIERAAAAIGVDGSSGHVGELEQLLNDLAKEWHSLASEEHRELMDRWSANVVRLATLTKKISTDLRGGTEELAQTASTLQLADNRFVQGLRGPS